MWQRNSHKFIIMFPSVLIGITRQIIWNNWIKQSFTDFFLIEVSRNLNIPLCPGSKLLKTFQWLPVLIIRAKVHDPPLPFLWPYLLPGPGEFRHCMTCSSLYPQHFRDKLWKHFPNLLDQGILIWRASWKLVVHGTYFRKCWIEKALNLSLWLHRIQIIHSNRGKNCSSPFQALGIKKYPLLPRGRLWKQPDKQFHKVHGK